MEEGSIVAINYTGKIVASGTVFESTVEKKAIEAGIFDKRAKYEPMAVVVGEGDVLRGLDKALLEMKAGETRSVLVKPADGWGERKPDNVAVVPLQQFRQRKIAPVPGLVVDVNGRQGKVQSVSGGRVRVDFNHPLAGKDLLYEVKVERLITLPKEQIEALYNKYFYMVPEKEKKLCIGKGGVEVMLSPRYSANLAPLKKLFSQMVTKHVKGFPKVRFVEEFEGTEGEGEVKEGMPAGGRGREEKAGKEKEAGKGETIGGQGEKEKEGSEETAGKGETKKGKGKAEEGNEREAGN